MYNNMSCPPPTHLGFSPPLSQEFCNKGTLSDGIECGWFRKRGSQYDLDYSALLRTAKEVCTAHRLERLQPPL